MCVRRCPALPHPPGCSTIGAVSLSFRVRNGTGRFPHAITTVTCDPTPTLGVGNLWSGDLSAIIGCPLTHRLLAGVGALLLYPYCGSRTDPTGPSVSGWTRY